MKPALGLEIAMFGGAMLYDMACLVITLMARYPGWPARNSSCRCTGRTWRCQVEAPTVYLHVFRQQLHADVENEVSCPDWADVQKVYRDSMSCRDHDLADKQFFRRSKLLMHQPALQRFDSPITIQDTKHKT
jgi:hypothetical protein